MIFIKFPRIALCILEFGLGFLIEFPKLINIIESVNIKALKTAIENNLIFLEKIYLDCLEFDINYRW